MSRPDLDLAKNMAVMEPYLAILADGVRRAFDTYQKLYPARVRAAHDNAAAAKNVHRHVLEEISIAVDSISGLAMVDVRGLMVLNVHDLMVIRFKKMDKAGHSVSYPTRQARYFDQQLPLPFLPPAAARLTFGYEPDMAFSAIVRVLMACPLGPRTHWCVQVNEEDGGAASWVDITPKRLPGTEDFKHYGSGDV